MKALTTAGLTKLIQLIKSNFISTTDTVTTNTVTLATVATSGSYNDLSNTPTIPTVDQTYDGTSANAQSGVAIEGELANYQETLTSGTNIKTINNTSILGSGNIDTSEIFIAEYGVTTYQEVLDAYNSSKMLFCNDDNKYFTFSRYINNTFEFRRLADSQFIYEVELANDNTWTNTPSKYADNSLSNLSATGKTVISGSWANANATIGSGLSINGTTPLEFTIGDIPNDGHKYEALISAFGTTSSTSGQICEIQLYSGKIYNPVAVCRGIPRTNTAIYISGNIIMPMAEDRKLYLQRASNYYGSVSLYLRGYRRIGSNT